MGNWKRIVQTYRAMLLAGRIVLLGLLLPAYLVLGICAVLSWLWRFGRALRALTRSRAVCPQGHGIPLYGVFECPRCRATFSGHAFRACPVCAATATWTPCTRCGLAIRNPLT